jgi:hypothetical protein
MPFGLPQDLALRAVTGSSPEGLENRVKSGDVPGMGKLRERFGQKVEADKQLHALSSFLIAKRLGVPASKFIGQGKEIVTGIMSAMGGGKFFGPGGYDPNDIAANAIGIKAAMEKWSRSKPTRATGVRG